MDCHLAKRKLLCWTCVPKIVFFLYKFRLIWYTKETKMKKTSKTTNGINELLKVPAKVPFPGK
jgi:hypothetical protein